MEQARTRARVYIPLPDEFLDVMGEPWQARQREGHMDLREVLIRTVRRAPVTTGEQCSGRTAKR